MSNWIYIDEIDHFPDVPAAHCDTRDFHIWLVDETNVEYYSISDEESPIRKCKGINLEDCLYAREEILGWLKSLEEGSGGNCRWRYLSFKNTDFKGWVKYIRFYKTEYEGKPCYFAYTTEGDRYYPLKRKQYIQENIKSKELYAHD